MSRAWTLRAWLLLACAGCLNPKPEEFPSAGAVVGAAGSFGNSGAPMHPSAFDDGDLIISPDLDPGGQVNDPVTSAPPDEPDPRNPGGAGADAGAPTPPGVAPAADAGPDAAD